MVINETILRKIVRESLVNFLREYEEGDENFDYDGPKTAGFELSLEDFSCYLPDGAENEELPQLEESYYITVYYKESCSSGDYRTPPTCDVKKMWITDDDGLLNDIQAVSNPEMKNILLTAYKNLEKAVANGDYNYCVYQ